MNVNSNRQAQRPNQRVGNALNRFRQYLHEEGSRYTQQRESVLEAVFRSGGHFDAEELLMTLQRNDDSVSRATVYRTLSHMERAGLIRQVMHRDGRACYEPTYGSPHHDHMVCVECGRVIEFVDERIEELQSSICRRHGFEAIDHRMGIRGICCECREGNTEE